MESLSIITQYLPRRKPAQPATSKNYVFECLTFLAKAAPVDKPEPAKKATPIADEPPRPLRTNVLPVVQQVPINPFLNTDYQDLNNEIYIDPRQNPNFGNAVPFGPSGIDQNAAGQNNILPPKLTSPPKVAVISSNYRDIVTQSNPIATPKYLYTFSRLAPDVALLADFERVSKIQLVPFDASSAQKYSAGSRVICFTDYGRDMYTDIWDNNVFGTKGSFVNGEKFVLIVVAFWKGPDFPQNTEHLTRDYNTVVLPVNGNRIGRSGLKLNKNASTGLNILTGLLDTKITRGNGKLFYGQKTSENPYVPLVPSFNNQYAAGNVPVKTLYPQTTGPFTDYIPSIVKPAADPPKTNVYVKPGSLYPDLPAPKSDEDDIVSLFAKATAPPTSPTSGSPVPVQFGPNASSDTAILELFRNYDPEIGNKYIVANNAYGNNMDYPFWKIGNLLEGKRNLELGNNVADVLENLFKDSEVYTGISKEGDFEPIFSPQMEDLKILVVNMQERYKGNATLKRISDFTERMYETIDQSPFNLPNFVYDDLREGSPLIYTISTFIPRRLMEHVKIIDYMMNDKLSIEWEHLKLLIMCEVAIFKLKAMSDIVPWLVLDIQHSKSNLIRYMFAAADRANSVNEEEKQKFVSAYIKYSDCFIRLVSEQQNLFGSEFTVYDRKVANVVAQVSTEQKDLPEFLKAVDRTYIYKSKELINSLTKSTETPKYFSDRGFPKAEYLKPFGVDTLTLMYRLQSIYKEEYDKINNLEVQIRKSNILSSIHDDDEFSEESQQKLGEIRRYQNMIAPGVYCDERLLDLIQMVHTCLKYKAPEQAITEMSK